LIDDLSKHLSDGVKWPTSEATKEGVDVAMKALRKGFKEDHYPRVFLYFTIIHIASTIYEDTVNRDVKFENFKQAWIKLADLFEDHK
jgi:hypothetical protein